MKKQNPGGCKGWNRRRQKMPVKVSRFIPMPLICVNLSPFRDVNVNKCDVVRTESDRNCVCSWGRRWEVATCYISKPCGWLTTSTFSDRESDLCGAHVSLGESASTCACACVWRVDSGSPSPSDPPVLTPFMASCLGECWSAIPTSPCSSLCLPAKPRPQPVPLLPLLVSAQSPRSKSSLCHID